VRRSILSFAALLAIAAPASAGAPGRALPERFHSEVFRIKGEVRERVRGSSWRRGCPVDLGNLRVVRLRHFNFNGREVRGALIVHEDETREIRDAMRALFRAEFPIRRMELIDRYGADDHRSMNADNTSAFNCRFVAGTSRWSEHAYGRAIDVNPIENPYVSGSHVSPPAGRPYADRSRNAKGMIHRGDRAYRAFKRVGWEWGGNWPNPTDYQHFSSTGR